MAEKRGFYMGVQLAGGPMMLNGDFGTYQTGGGYGGGSFIVGGMITPHFGLFGAVGGSAFVLQLSERNYEYNARFDVDATANYVHVTPLMIRFISGKSKRLGFFADIGMRMDFLTSVDGTNTIYLDGSYFASESTSSEDFAVAMFTPFAYMGLKIPVRRISFNIGPEFQYTSNMFDGTGGVYSSAYSINGKIGINVRIAP